MCSRREVREAQAAQDKAADALAGLCIKGLCSDDIGAALHSLYDPTVREGVPSDFRELLGKLA